PTTFNSTSILMPEFTIDNNGNLAYFFGYSNGGQKQAAMGFISMAGTTPKFADIKVEPSDGIMAVLMKYTSNKLTGAFTTHNTKKSGICYFSADVSKGEVLTSDCKAFTSDLANNLNYVSGQYYPGEKGYEATGMEEINGNYYYIIEHSSENEQSLGGGTMYKGGYGGQRVDMGGATSFSDYIKRNIVIAKINTTSNKIEWMQVVPKFVVNSVGGRSDIKLDDINGTYFIPADKKLFLFYLENPDIEKSIAQGKKINLDKLDHVSESSKNANVVCYEIDENKNVKRSIVYANKEMDARPLSKNNNVILEKGKSVLVYFHRGKSESLGSFTIK
ncbi:MAG TPA: hypothetical protein VNX68_09265, partial [Nitrosopumilaceae archaeon]|nr:hypothetical protein [Nitrosopumilaceae archaeon]